MSGGRTIKIHPEEAFHQEHRAKQATIDGLKKLRERVEVEHALAHIANRQGPQARYRGVRKNDFDVRRTAAIHKLNIAQRLAA